MRVLRTCAAVAGIAGVLASGISGATQPLHVLFLGDSLTYGDRASTPANSFPARVTAALVRRAPTVASVHGQPAVVTAYWHAASIPRITDVAVVELGTNDVYRQTPIDKFTADYQHLMAMVHARSPKAKIVCLSAWWPPADTRGNPRPYNQVIQDSCPGRYVNIARFAHPPNISAKDNFHPNDAGHRLIAQVVLPAIRSLVG